MARGGKRDNAGRKEGSKNKIQSGLKARSIRLTDSEYNEVREFVKQLRLAEKPSE